MELVPPNREKWLSLQRWQKTLLKKWKSKSEFVKPSLFTVTWQEFFYVWQAVTWTFTFLVGILLSLVNVVIFSLLGGTSSILRTFLGGTSEKNHPVYQEFANISTISTQIICFEHNLGRIGRKTFISMFKYFCPCRIFFKSLF